MAVLRDYRLAVTPSALALGALLASFNLGSTTVAAVYLGEVRVL